MKPPKSTQVRRFASKETVNRLSALLSPAVSSLWLRTAESGWENFRENNRQPPWALSLLPVPELRLSMQGGLHACLQQFSFPAHPPIFHWLRKAGIASEFAQQSPDGPPHRPRVSLRTLFENPLREGWDVSISRRFLSSCDGHANRNSSSRFVSTAYSSHCIDDRENHASNRP